ncbi:ectonucleoside triphosphate diphosphohydrolase 8 isoform X13 [Delphinapterus leucas]|uniref:Ectonucleoside triphosphate diphosphohydrolase 8 n=1 Tax=Delphinapterus leucas TaxID=9749 RepID=A0A2Y9NI59_DELLE|nr:ectonucleoside triphosphate diphosphohydrolase 8 isoform X13 [Delphinapterus leucas]
MGLTWRERAFTALLGAAAVSGLTTLILFLVEATNVLLPADTKFGIVFDAGSSHTSLLVYQWPANKENDTGVVSQALACRAKAPGAPDVASLQPLPRTSRGLSPVCLKSPSSVSWPGISSYASDPAQAGESLQGCLEEALALIPKAKHQQTPMFLGATGGMRLLSRKNSSQAEDVFAAVSQALSRSPVAFWGAELLAGQDEGALGWVTINYVLGLLVQLRRPRRLRLRQGLPAPRAGTVLRLLQLLPHLPLPEPHLQAAAGHGQCHHLGVLPEALEAGGGELARAGRPAARLLCLGPVHPHAPARGLRVQPGDLGRHRVPQAGRWHRHRLDAGLHAEPDRPDPSRGARPVAGTELWRLGGRSRLFGADPHGHSRGHCGAALAPGLGWLPPGAGRQRPELARAFLSPNPKGSPCGLWPHGHMAPFCRWGHSGHGGCAVAPTMAFRCQRPSGFPMLHEGWAIATPAALRAV